MKNKLGALVVICYTLTALSSTILAFGSDSWPWRLIVAFSFAFLAVQQYRRYFSRASRAAA